MKRIAVWAITTLAIALLQAPGALAQVNDWSKDEFQYKFTFNNIYHGQDGKTSPTASMYVYIPQQTTQIKSVLLLQQNLIEQRIAVDPAIRAMADANDVAIVWSNPGYDLNYDNIPDLMDDYVQQQLGVFGQSIGYAELGSAPVITFGHSNTSAYSQNLPNARPNRVVAAIQTHGTVYLSTYLWDNTYTGPFLTFQGQYMEQKQQTKDVISNQNIGSISRVNAQLDNQWMPISVVEEYGSGHYDYSDQVVEFMADFMGKAVQSRVNTNGTLNPVDPNTGYIIVVPNRPTSPLTVKAYATATASEKANGAWYFDQELAQKAADILYGNGPWNRDAQMIGFTQQNGTFSPFGNDGLATAPYVIAPGTNQITFFPTLLEEVPAGFNQAGTDLAQSSDDTITLEWDNGPSIYQDAQGNYHVELNRGGAQGYLLARNLGDDDTRPAVQPTHFRLNTVGNGSYTVTVPTGLESGDIIALPNLSTASEYVGYYIDHGPARILGDNALQILDLPMNATGPLEIELVVYGLSSAGITGKTSITFVAGSVAAIPGDLNGDGFVGQDDLNIILGAWGQSVTPGDVLAGDPSGDGFVGQDDLNEVLAGWGQGTPPAAAVPEPTTLALTGVVSLAVILRRRGA